MLSWILIFFNLSLETLGILDASKSGSHFVLSTSTIVVLKGLEIPWLLGSYLVTIWHQNAIFQERVSFLFFFVGNAVEGGPHWYKCEVGKTTLQGLVVPMSEAASEICWKLGFLLTLFYIQIEPVYLITERLSLIIYSLFLNY